VSVGPKDCRYDKRRKTKLINMPHNLLFEILNPHMIVAGFFSTLKRLIFENLRFGRKVGTAAWTRPE
jgi:hypothetical protein